MSKANYYPVMTIAGSDSSGGAGIQADIKTISAIGCYAMSAITSLTSQNTTGVEMIMAVTPEMVRSQILYTASDISPLAVKTGMLCNAVIVKAVADALRELRKKNPDLPIVVDPVMVSTSGSQLLEHEAIDVMKREIFPIATLVTPNCAEALFLAGSPDPKAQISTLRDLGCRNILLKGGDSERKDIKADILALEGDDEWFTLVADAVDTKNTHGTGCTLSSAIASYLALGYSLPDAVESGKLFITKALRAGAGVAIGHGHGPVNHFFQSRHLKKRFR
ncbi:MAG: bifunctional hydroxymethylpyrimidine kinase/phosphomethylpyrimidine kinase [Lachnoclostridium sp.]|nr:bifunctional hydroxymethylpyrimidine kinase/phosphomethylpyrimidine kinase [Lachnoclostridium sp.]